MEMIAHALSGLRAHAWCHTHLLPGAAHSHAVRHGHMGGGGGAGARVLSEAQVVIGAQVDHVLHDSARVAERANGGKRLARWRENEGIDKER